MALRNRHRANPTFISVWHHFRADRAPMDRPRWGNPRNRNRPSLPTHPKGGLMPSWLTDLQGIGAILSGIAAIIAAIYARSASKEMKPDHGTSMRDLIDVMDDRIKSLGHRQGELHDDIQSFMQDARDDHTRLWKELEKIQR